MSAITERISIYSNTYLIGKRTHCLRIIYVPNNDIRGMLLVASNISFISQLCKPSLFYFIIIFLVSLLVYTSAHPDVIIHLALSAKV